MTLTRRSVLAAVSAAAAAQAQRRYPNWKPSNARWWRFRIPGQGAVDWKGFFAVLAETGYTGAMNIENEDEFYYPASSQGNFTEQYKRGFRAAHEFLKTMVPPLTA